MHVLNVEGTRYPQSVRSLLAASGEVDYVECAGQSELVAALGSAPYDALFVRLGLRVDSNVFDAAPNLRYVCTPTTGLDHIDTDAARARNVTVISLCGETEFLSRIRSTAEHTWAITLALIRRLPRACADVLEGNWRREPFIGDELFTKTLGVVGYGRLGRMVAEYGAAFGMRVMVADRAGAIVSAPSGVIVAPLELVLSEADVVSIHVPLTAETERLIGAERLQQMKSGAVLVNTSRGEIVDEVALRDCLASGHLAGAALDVLAGDSSWESTVPESHPLVEYARNHDNVVITPHTGGYALPSLVATRRFITEKFLDAVRAHRSSQ